MAKTIKVDVTVDTSDVDKAQEDINKLQKSAKTISSKIDVDSSELKDAEEDINDLKKKSKIEVTFNADTGDVDILSEKTLTLTQQASLLRKELQRIPEGTDQWIAVNQKYNDTRDAIDRVNVKSQELFGTLSLLPGPFGDIANSADNTINTFKQLDGISLKELKANLKGFGDDIKGVFATLGKLTGITKLYTTLNNGLAAGFRAVGLSSIAASNGVRVFSGALIGTGIGAIVVGLGMLISKLSEVGKTAEDITSDLEDKLSKSQALTDKIVNVNTAVTDQQIEDIKAKALAQGKSLDDITVKTEIYNKELEKNQILLNALRDAGINDVPDALIQAQNDAFKEVQNITRSWKSWIPVQILSLTGAATPEEDLKQLDKVYKKIIDIREKFEDQLQIAELNTTTNRKKLENDQTLAERDAEKERIENLKKSIEQRKKLIEDYYARLREIDLRESAAQQVNISAFRSTLDDRLKQELAIEDAYEESRKTLLRANITDFTNIERERFAALFEVRKKYAQQDLEKTLSDLNNRFEQEKFLLDKKLADGLMTEVDYNNQLLELEKQNNDAILEQTEKFYADLQKSLDDAFESGLITQSYYDSQTLSLTQALNDKKIEIYKTANGLILKGVENTNKAIEDQFEKSMKSYDDKLKLLELKGQILNKNGKRWFDNAREILELSLAKELAILEKSKGDELKLVGDNEEKRSVVIKQYEELVTATTQKYSQDRKDIKQQEIAAYGEVASALIDSFGAVTSAIASGYDEEAKTSKEAFEKRKKLQKATAIMSAASGIINILTQPSTLPSPFDFIVKGINAAALGIATKVQIDNINKTEFESQSGGSGGSSQLSFSQPSAPTPSIGSSQSQTGVIANIVDKAVQRDQSKDRPIRTYVVQNDITTEQQLSRRIRTAARLG